MKVYVVVRTVWNGEFDANCIDRVLASKEAAEKYVEEAMMFERRGPYSPSYEYEEHEVK